MSATPEQMLDLINRATYDAIVKMRRLGGAQKILDEAKASGNWMAQSVWDALEIEAHNDRCEAFRRSLYYPNGCPVLSEGPQKDDL